jgi:hypothetical protein
VVGALLLAACAKDPPAPTAHEQARAALTCTGCHTPEFRTTTHPPHPGARPTACGVCHSQSSWHGWRVDHPGWKLTGAHERAAADKALAGKESQVKCFWCHREDTTSFKVAKKDCMGCHADDRERASSPPHEELSLACETCHSTEGWKPATRPVPEHDASVPEPPIAADAGAPPASSSAPPRVAPPRPTAAPKPTAPKPTPPPPPRPTATTPKPDVTTQPSRRR